MSKWIMTGVWRHILLLPPAIGKRRVERLGARARAEIGAMSDLHRVIHHFVVRELPGHGIPIQPQMIAESLGLPSAEVGAVLADLEARKTFLYRNEDGAVVWAYPVTVEPTPHRIRFKSGETLYAA